jgi:hypothetical protein
MLATSNRQATTASTSEPGRINLINKVSPARRPRARPLLRSNAERKGGASLCRLCFPVRHPVRLRNCEILELELAERGTRLSNGLRVREVRQLGASGAAELNPEQ